ADALAVLEKYRLKARTPASILRHLGDGILGEVEETPEKLPATVRNIVIANNARSLGAAERTAEGLGYRVLNLGSFLEGETGQVATALAGTVRSIRADGRPCSPPACVLSGGETTVTLAAEHGLGGRNQEFVLAVLDYLGLAGIRGVVALSGGTDGDDGP